MISSVEELAEIVRIPSPCPAPQALAFDGASLWVGSWETNRVYCIDAHQGTVLEETVASGKPIGATVVGDEIFFVISEEGDSRFVRRFVPGHGFKTKSGFACPDDTGSFLAFDGTGLWLTQRGKRRVLSLDADGNVLHTVDIGEQMIGATFVDDRLYLSIWLGAERGCYIAYIEPKAPSPALTYVGRVPFEATSLARDGAHFWTNDYDGNAIVGFEFPK